jgi:CelD/BcsL family acetyltransferase involved in cellulose biosynthesis
VHGTIESAFRIEWKPLGELCAVAAEWWALAARALEPNVFYEPAFARAAAPVFGQGVGAGLVWSRGSPARLLGFFPACIERRRYGVPLPVLVGWTHPYGPLGVPLVDRDGSEAIVAAWLDHVANNRDLPDLLLLPYLTLANPFARVLDEIVARRGGASATFGRHARALLVPGDDRAGYLDHAVGHKKRKELRRQRKRLADQGAVTVTSTGEAAAVRKGVADFIALEAAGWKGRAGSAVQDDADVRQFFATAVGALADEGKVRLGRLFVGTRPVAAIVTLMSGNTAWCWKVAYDESVAHASPGVQLLLEVTRELLDDTRIARGDSCATENHPMIDHVWRERLAIGDRLIHVGPGGASTFALARTLEASRRAAIGGAKTLRDLIRRR